MNQSIIIIKTHGKDLQLKLSYCLFSYILTFGVCYLNKVTILFYFSKAFLLLNKKFIFTQLTTAF